MIAPYEVSPTKGTKVQPVDLKVIRVLCFHSPCALQTDYGWLRQISEVCAGIGTNLCR